MESADRVNTAEIADACATEVLSPERKRIVFCTLQEYAKMRGISLSFLERQAKAGKMGIVKEFGVSGRYGFRYVLPLGNERLKAELSELKVEEVNGEIRKLVDAQAEFAKKLNRRIDRQNRKTMKQYRRLCINALLYEANVSQVTLVPKINENLIGQLTY